MGRNGFGWQNERVNDKSIASKSGVVKSAHGGHADAKRGEPHALDAIIDEGTLTIGWVGPALLGILIAVFGWAGRVFGWLGTLATVVFGGVEGRGEV